MKWTDIRSHYEAVFTETRQKGVTQAEVARRGGLPGQNAISKLLANRKRGPSAETFIGAVRGLGLPVSVFFAQLEGREAPPLPAIATRHIEELLHRMARLEALVLILVPPTTSAAAVAAAAAAARSLGIRPGAPRAGTTRAQSDAVHSPTFTDALGAHGASGGGSDGGAAQLQTTGAFEDALSSHFESIASDLEGGGAQASGRRKRRTSRARHHQPRSRGSNRERSAKTA
jgi:transcriptional regulator with XRE-family HTH domain